MEIRLTITDYRRLIRCFLLMPLITGTFLPGMAVCAESLLVVCTLPTAANRTLVDELRNTASEGVEVDLLVTMGDLGKVQEKIDSRQPETQIVCLDMPALRAVSALEISRPVITLPSLLAVDDEVSSLSSALVVETCPTAEDVVRVLEHAGLHDAELGLVYTYQYAPSEAFARTISKSRDRTTMANTGEKEFGTPACVIDPGACRSLGDIEFALRRTFKDLPPGSPVVVYPEGNTLKFAYAFERYAEENDLVLVSVGDFPRNKAPLAVYYSPNAIARAILRSMESEEKAVRPEVSLRVDKDSLNAILTAVHGSKTHDSR